MNKQQQRSEETKTHILAAAESCFAQGGYDGTSVARICQEAGVSKGAFYHHFESKQAVFLALLYRWLALMDGQMDRLDEGAAEVPERLLAMTGILGQLLRVPHTQLLIYLEYLNMAARDPQIWESTVQPYFQYREAISGLVEAGTAEGSLRGVEPKTASIIVIAMAIGLLLQGFIDPDGADWDKVAQEGMGLLIDGFRQ
jgi:AcrR family transcriptional regulator